jgi:hypothetical protein
MPQIPNQTCSHRAEVSNETPCPDRPNSPQPADRHLHASPAGVTDCMIRANAAPLRCAALWSSLPYLVVLGLAALRPLSGLVMLSMILRMS